MFIELERLTKKIKKKSTHNIKHVDLFIESNEGIETKRFIKDNIESRK
jgi:hypothetical protein